MFSDLIQLFQENGYFREKELRHLTKTCPTTTISVLDFNEIKKLFSIIKHTVPRLSVTGIKFLNTSKLYFIQAESPDLNCSFQTPTDADNFAKNLCNGDIQEKIRGTVSTLSDMVAFYGLRNDFETFFSFLPETLPRKPSEKIETILLYKITDRDLLIIRFAFRLRLQFNSDPILSDIIILNCDRFASQFAE